MTVSYLDCQPKIRRSSFESHHRCDEATCNALGSDAHLEQLRPRKNSFLVQWLFVARSRVNSLLCHFREGWMAKLAICRCRHHKSGRPGLNKWVRSVNQAVRKLPSIPGFSAKWMMSDNCCIPHLKPSIWHSLLVGYSIADLLPARLPYWYCTWSL